MAAGALKPTVGKADQITMNTVSSVTSTTLQARPGGAAAPAQGQTGEAQAYAMGMAHGAAAFPLVAAQAARLPEIARARMIELTEILAETAAGTDPIGYQRADAELHALLLRATDNRMLEHLAAVVYGALEITGTRPLGCVPGPGVDQHTVLVDRVLAGD